MQKLVIEIVVKQEPAVQEPVREVPKHGVRLMQGAHYVHIVHRGYTLCNRYRPAVALRETTQSVATCKGCIVGAVKEIIKWRRS